MNISGGVILLGLGAGLLVVLTLILVRFGAMLGRALLVVLAVVVILILAFVAASGSLANVNTATAAKTSARAATGPGGGALLCIGAMGGVAVAGVSLAGVIYARRQLADRWRVLPPGGQRREIPPPSGPYVWHAPQQDDAAAFDPAQWGWR
jgi:hypothetical protein